VSLAGLKTTDLFVASWLPGKYIGTILPANEGPLGTPKKYSVFKEF
jgi:hypothetical protein